MIKTGDTQSPATASRSHTQQDQSIQNITFVLRLFSTLCEFGRYETTRSFTHNTVRPNFFTKFWLPWQARRSENQRTIPIPSKQFGTFRKSSFQLQNPVDSEPIVTIPKKTLLHPTEPANDVIPITIHGPMSYFHSKATLPIKHGRLSCSSKAVLRPIKIHRCIKILHELTVTA